MDKIYAKNQYNVYKVEDGFIVHNTEMKDFAHSHIKNYKTCLWIIELSLNKKCPYNLPKYLVISLIRLNNDDRYLYKLNSLLEKRNNKKINYFNSNKGVRNK